MHKNNFRKFAIPILALAAATLSCSQFTGPTPQPAATLNALYTSAAQTLEAMSTQGSSTLTAQPFATETLALPGAVTATGFATYTAVPPLQTIVSRCDAAAFVSDVTYPDGSTVALGSSFTKTWRIRNTGTCTWNTSYSLVFVSGEKLGGPNAIAVPGNVGPGQTVDLSVNLSAPNKAGDYIGYWKLRSSSGALFGVGASGDANVYVDINVDGYTVSAYNFRANFCDAVWENNDKTLPCPGTDGDDDGFVLSVSDPKLEDGKSSGNGLLTYPERGNNGTITGKYPAVTIKTGDRFQTSISCQYKADECDVIFRLQYQIGSGSVKTLGQWREVYEGGSYPIAIDLSFLNGEKVKFIFTVMANGSSHEDFALWITPRITRQSDTPPTKPAPSRTPTPTGSPTLTTTTTITSTVTSTATATPTATDTPTPTP